MAATRFMWYQTFRVMWDLTDLLFSRRPFTASGAEGLAYQETRRILLESLAGLPCQTAIDAGLPADLGEVARDTASLLWSARLLPALEHLLAVGPHDRGRVGGLAYCEATGRLCPKFCLRRLNEDLLDVNAALGPRPKRGIGPDYWRSYPWNSYLESKRAAIEDARNRAEEIPYAIWRQKRRGCPADPACERRLAESGGEPDCDPGGCPPFMEWLRRELDCDPHSCRPFWGEAAEAHAEPNPTLDLARPTKLALSAIMRQVREWREAAGLPASVNLSGKGGREYYDATDPDPDAEDTASSGMPGAEATGTEAVAAAVIPPELKGQTCLFITLLVTERLQGLLQAALGDGSALHQPGAEYAYLVLRGYLERLSSQTPEDERTTEELLEALPKALGLLFVAPGEPEYLYGEGECEWEFAIRPALIKAVAELRAEVVRRGLLSVLYGTDGQSGDAPVIEETLNLKEIDRVIRVVEEEKAAHLKRLLGQGGCQGEPLALESQTSAIEGQRPDGGDAGPDGASRMVAHLESQAKRSRQRLWYETALCLSLLHRIVEAATGAPGAVDERCCYLYEFLRREVIGALRYGRSPAPPTAAMDATPESMRDMAPGVLGLAAHIQIAPALRHVLGFVGGWLGLDGGDPIQLPCGREISLCIRLPEKCPEFLTDAPCPLSPLERMPVKPQRRELIDAANLVAQLESERGAQDEDAQQGVGQEREDQSAPTDDPTRRNRAWDDAATCAHLLRRLVNGMIADDIGTPSEKAAWFYDFLRDRMLRELRAGGLQRRAEAAERGAPLKLPADPAVLRCEITFQVLPALRAVLQDVAEAFGLDPDFSTQAGVCEREGRLCLCDEREHLARRYEDPATEAALRWDAEHPLFYPRACPDLETGRPCPYAAAQGIFRDKPCPELEKVAEMIAELEGGPGSPSPLEAPAPVPARGDEPRRGRPADFGEIRTREDLLKAVRHCLGSLKPEEWTKSCVIEKLRELRYVSISERHFDTRIRNEPFCFASWAQLRDEARSLPSQ